MGKARGKKQQKESDSEELDDVMAWGNKKQNYYGEDENQYSEASQEYQQAQQIYRRQQKDLNNANYYQFPSDEESAQQVNQQDIQNQVEQQQLGINDEYLDKQIKWCSQLSQVFGGIQDQKSKYRAQVSNNYLLILLCLKQFKSIPYLQHHPMIENMAYLRKGLVKLERELHQIMEREQPNAQYNDEDQMQNSENDENQQDSMNDIQEQENLSEQEFGGDDEQIQGLNIYEKIKAEKDEERKTKKLEQKQKRDEQLKNVKAFKTIGENQGRLASQKIIKNKGLMKRRKKIDGNSRVKLRQKYRKAQIKQRAKGKIGVRENPGRFYEGQKKITIGKISSTKL